MKQFSIARRLAILLALGTAASWIAAALIAGFVMERELNAAFDETLRQSALRLLPLAIHDMHEIGEGEERRVGPLGDDGEPTFSYYIRDRNGALIVLATDAANAVPNIRVPDGFSDFDGERLYSATDPQSGFGIVVVEQAGHRSQALRESVIALTLPLAGLLPLMALGIWFAVTRALRPVEQLRNDIAARDSRDLSPLSAAGHPKELAPIAEAVADLLQRLGLALEAERSFAASSAHELRTPIAGALAQTQRLLIELDYGPGRERLKEIETALRNLSNLANRLLQLSRLDAGFARSDGDRNLVPVLKFVVADLQAGEATAGQIRLDIADDAVLMAAINEDAFALAIRNLVQNARIHGAKNNIVEISADPGPRVRVVNAGPVVASDVLANLGQPFQRGATRASGSGLGLSIVRSIMEQTGGTMALHSPARGRDSGFEVVLDWSAEARHHRNGCG
jgi:two-component system OmpR family sensor kinase